METSRLAYLYQRYINNQVTPAEKAELLEMFSEGANDETLNQLFENHWKEFNPQHSVFNANESEAIFNKIIPEANSQEIQTGRVTPFVWQRIAAAAAILVVLAFGAYSILIKQPSQQLSNIQKHDIEPGSNKAVLTLADGSTIVLGNARNGVLAKQSSTAILKEEGQLVYNASEAQSTSNTQLNTITTPRGGEYLVVLPDGTRVWLNAESSLKFPVAFIGKERNVELIGEAYFEVSVNKKMPFKVSANNTKVEVLGTHFNVMAYADEIGTKTTLLEGSVKVLSGDNSKIIKPGQQAQVTNDILVSSVDVDDVIAWKNGIISFRDADIRTIMRQVSRWYDVEVVYKDEPSKLKFTGDISRRSNISKVLKLLKLSDIRLTLEGRKVIYTNN